MGKGPTVWEDPEGFWKEVAAQAAHIPGHPLLKPYTPNETVEERQELYDLMGGFFSPERLVRARAVVKELHDGTRAAKDRIAPTN